MEIEAGGGFVGFAQDAHVEAVVDDEGVGRDAVHDEDVAADGAAAADDGFAAEDGRAGIDRDVVLDGWVALFSLEQLAAGGRARAEGDAVIELHVVSDHAGFADHGAGAVIDEKVRTNFRAGVNVHPGAAVRPFGHDAGDKRDFAEVQFVREALHGDGLDERVGDDDFVLAQRGGITVERGLGVGLQERADAREILQKIERELVGVRAVLGARQVGGRGVGEALADFFIEAAEDGIHESGGLDADFGKLHGAVVEKSGEQQPQQIDGDAGDGALGREIFPVEMIDASHGGVGSQQLIGELGDGDVHARSIWDGGGKGK